MAKSTRLAVKRELQRAANNVEWAGRHLIAVHARCEAQEHAEASEAAEGLILLAQAFKREIERFEACF